jgi:KipI family sensor histidine kinase inhibitor
MNRAGPEEPRRFEIHRVAERALLVRFTDDDLARAVARSHALCSTLAGPARLEGEAASTLNSEPKISVKGEWVPGAGNLLLRLDDSVDARQIAALRRQLNALLASLPVNESLSLVSSSTFSSTSSLARPPLEVRVRFGGPDGEDLPSVARETGLTTIEVVRKLCAADLMVAFIGFAYLIGLPPELELPRLAEPRPQVPAGSVAIAGPFAGIYPSATPGGWRLLGIADLELFDATNDPPARLAPGDRIRFIAV